MSLGRRHGWQAVGSRVRSDHARFYAVSTGVFLVVTVLGALALGWVLRIASLNEAQRNLDQLSTSVAEQVSRFLQVVDITLQDTVHRVEIAAARKGADPETFLADPEVRTILLTPSRQRGALDGLTLVDARGRVVNTSRTSDGRSVNVRDRDYFSALQGDAAPELYVSVPMISRFTGALTLFFSRRLDFGTSAFKGLVLGAMPAARLTASLQQVAANPHIIITLERRDHVVLARIPATAPQAEPGSRLIASRAAGGEALRVVVSMDRNNALAMWRNQAIGILIAVAAVSVCVLLILFALLRQFRAERAAQDALTRRNHELEAARHALERRTAELEESTGALRAGEALLAERSATLNTTLEHITQGIMMVDASGHVRVYNQQAIELLGLPEDLLARSPLFAEVIQYQLDQGEFAPADRAMMIDLIRSDPLSDTRQVYTRVRPNGQVIEFNTVPVPGGGLVRTYTDITDLRRAQDQIERTALYDELTGLPNRLSLRRVLEDRLRTRADGDEITLLYINLDRFRLLNDARGHSVGDQILVEIARRLQAMARQGDFIGRTGGDEFAIIHPKPAGHADALAIGQHVLRLLAETYSIDGRRIALTASIGVAVSAGPAGPDVLLRNSEIAMYRAKDAGRNQLCRYEAAMAAAQEEQFQLEQSLRESLGTAAFRLVYQPIVALENDEITGFEALLRWTDRVRGEVSPGLFIPIAEATGLIVPLGRSVLEWACLEAASWSVPRTIAVNLSPAQFQGGALPRLVREMLAETGLPAERLELEVTEGMLLEDTGPVHETMFALREIGVSLTLDDFGTGHAGLSYLRRFPFSKIKIDRSFIRNLGTGGESDVIVEEMLSLGRRLGLRVVAEGVELESQLERLRGLGCTYVQGFLTGRPVSPEIARHL